MLVHCKGCGKLLEGDFTVGGDVWCSKECFGRDNHVILFDAGQEKTDEQHRQEVEHELAQALLQVQEAEVPLPDNPINYGKPPNRRDYLPGGREHKRVIPAMRRLNKAAATLRKLEGLPEKQHPSEISYAASVDTPADKLKALAAENANLRRALGDICRVTADLDAYGYRCFDHEAGVIADKALATGPTDAVRRVDLLESAVEAAKAYREAWVAWDGWSAAYEDEEATWGEVRKKRDEFRDADKRLVEALRALQEADKQ